MWLECFHFGDKVAHGKQSNYKKRRKMGKLSSVVIFHFTSTTYTTTFLHKYRTDRSRVFAIDSMLLNHLSQFISCYAIMLIICLSWLSTPKWFLILFSHSSSVIIVNNQWKQSNALEERFSVSVRMVKHNLVFLWLARPYRCSSGMRFVPLAFLCKHNRHALWKLWSCPYYVCWWSYTCFQNKNLWLLRHLSVF